MKPFVSCALAAFLLSACNRPAEAPATPAPSQTPAAQSAPAPSDPNAHRMEIEQWQAKRAERLRAEDGWLTLVALDWLKEGANRFGSAPGSELPLPEPAPAKMGTLTLQGGKVTLNPSTPMTIDGKPVEGLVPLLDDNDQNGPTVVQAGTMRFQIIRRGDRIGLRVKDANAATRVGFKGLEYFPIDAKYRVEARFDPYQPMKQIPIVDVTGAESKADVPGALVFTIDGQEHRLDAILEEPEADQLFIIFRDATSKDATYPAGRYLYIPKPGADNKAIVDFNKAYNPPCAFTPFATCPLPPPQNRLPIRIEAGEKKYAGAGH